MHPTASGLLRRDPGFDARFVAEHGRRQQAGVEQRLVLVRDAHQVVQVAPGVGGLVGF